jgi:hypothetical protein
MDPALNRLQADTIEHKRLDEARTRGVPWKKWGPI